MSVVTILCGGREGKNVDELISDFNKHAKESLLHDNKNSKLI